MRTRWLTAVVGLLVIAVAAATTVAVLSRRDLARSHDRVQQLQARIEELRSRLDAARSPTAPATSTPSPGSSPTSSPTDPATAEAGGTGDGPAGGLLDALGGGVPGVECLARPPSDGGLEGLLGGDDTPGEPQALVDHIAAEVAALRELPLGGDLDAELLSPDETARRIGELLAEDYSARDADTERRLLASLGVIPADTDLRALRRDLLAGQVAGFYVPDSGELVVRSAGGGTISVTDQVTLAHEIDHALTDRALRLPVDDAAPSGADAALAALAVVEGDASLVMNRWALEHLGLAQQLSLAADPAVRASQAQLEQAPHYLVRELVFPYVAGLDLACDAWLDGGWDAVDALYADPPETTAQVMFPERRGAGPPGEAPDLTAPSGWRERRTDTFGAAQLSWLFEAPGSAPDRALSDPERRASAWAAGTAMVWADGDRTAVGLSLVARGDGSGLCDSVTAWYAAAFPGATRSAAAGEGSGDATTFDGGTQDAVVACPGDRVRVGIAPAAGTAAAIAGVPAAG